MPVECEVIGDCTLYHCRWEAVYEALPKDAAIVSDPPYGIAFDYTKTRRHGSVLLRGMGQTPTNPRSRWSSNVTGDTAPFDPMPWLAFRQLILWGANHYASRLPDSGAWLIWDKRDGRTSDAMSDCELAWSNIGTAARLHRQLWRGMVRVGDDNLTHGGKTHPAQKPIELMRWCVEKTTGLVIDPFAGSCSTGVAALQLGRAFIGVEVERCYFDIGCQRLTAAYQQLALFPPPVPPVAAQQQALFQ